MSKRIKMIVGGICNLILLVTFALILVVLSENHVVNRVLAVASSSSGSLSELNSDQVILTTQDIGSFVGKRKLVPSDDPNDLPKSFFSFRGIPYAAPPLGELRWAPPEPLELKSTPQQASEYKPPCSQWSSLKKKVVGVPDCLYLNIFTSYIPSSSRRTISGRPWTVENPNLLPVLVYVHGGEFISGSGTRYSPEAIMKRERNVVFVTFNYRLGVLGFLSSGDERLPGNYGLLDQIMALKWIQKYIHKFGGNPLRVTIFGSVEHLLLANTTKVDDDQQELFHSAILKPQSTSLLSPFQKFESREGAKNFLKHLADNIGCKSESGNSSSSSLSVLIECLRNADTESLIRSQTKLLTFHNLPFPNYNAIALGPVVDNELLADEPENLFNSGEFKNVPLMIGLGANEGFNLMLEFYLKLYQKNLKNGPSNDENPDNNDSQNAYMTLKQNLVNVLGKNEVNDLLKSILQTAMSATPDVERNGAFERVFESIWSYYLGETSEKSTWDNETVDQVVQKLLRLFGDMFVNTGHCKLLHALAVNSNASVYAYVFSHGTGNFSDFFHFARETFEKAEGIGNNAKKRPKRSLHMSLDTPLDETFYLFHPIKDEINFPNRSFYAPSEELAHDDRIMTDTLVKIWTNFAKHSRPVLPATLDQLPEQGKWIKVEPGHRSLNYYLISNLPLQQGMRSDYRKAECQFWMSTIPQVRTLSKAIQDLEPFPILFWSSVAVVVLFALIIVTLIVLIVCVKNRTGSYGGDAMHLSMSRGY